MVSPLVDVIKQTKTQQGEIDRLSKYITLTEDYLEIKFGYAAIRLYEDGRIVSPLVQSGIYLDRGVVINDARNLNQGLDEVPEEC